MVGLGDGDDLASPLLGGLGGQDGLPGLTAVADGDDDVLGAQEGGSGQIGVDVLVVKGREANAGGFKSMASRPEAPTPKRWMRRPAQISSTAAVRTETLSIR